MAKMKTVIKRDGRKVDFDKEKIISALKKAFLGTPEDLTPAAEALIDEIAGSIEEKVLSSRKTYSIEEIQDMIEHALKKSSYQKVADAFITYRKARTIERRKHTDLYKRVKEKVMATNVENQNANVDEHSFGGRKGEANAVVMRDIALNDIMSDLARENHLNNEIYTHDLDSYAVGMSNCLTVPFDDLLREGFNTRQTDVRPANSVNTAFQLVAVLFQLQSLQQFGGVSASHLDWTMVPYVRKSFYKHYKEVASFLHMVTPDVDIPETSIEDRKYKGAWFNFIRHIVWKEAISLTKKETEQAVEGMYHNLNTLQSRSGNQLPFTSLNYGTCTLSEGRMVTKAILDMSLKGVGKLHKTPIFPCGIFQYMKGVNDKPGTPNYDLFRLAVKSTCSRLYPNYANVDWSGNAGYDRNDPETYMSTMGCRTYNGFDANGFGQMKDGRGNIAPVTIILPTLAMEAVEKNHATVGSGNNAVISSFLDLLDQKLHEAKDILLERFDWICFQSPESAKFMWENHTMRGYVPEEGPISALKHGTLVIGQLGLAEALQILLGTDQTTEDGIALARRIEELIKTRCAEFKKEPRTYTDKNGMTHEWHMNCGVYMTPAENLCYTAMTKFKEKYGEIPNVSDRDFFTNSIHCPVWKELSPFEKVDIESQLTGYSSAGCITYVELDDGAKNNTQAVEQIIKYAMDKDIPYFAINVPADTCLSCGYTDEINDTCPACGSSNIQHLRRVTGYLTGDYKSAFNKGKQQEVSMRYKHSGKLTGWKKE